MTFLLVTWVLGCDRGGGPADTPSARAPDASDFAPPRLPPEATGGARSVAIVLEPGQLTDDGWVGLPLGADRLTTPVAAEATKGEERAWLAILPPGPAVARIERAGCGPVEVPYTVGPVGVVVLPYPACDEPDAPVIPGTTVRLDRAELPWSLVEALHGLELFLDVPAPTPGQEDGPARWITLEEARAVCAWRGGRLPTRAEWLSARDGATGTPVANETRSRLGSSPVGVTARALAKVPPHVTPAGHADLDGNVEEWLADGDVAGGSWMSLPDELGRVRSVPASARTETIGVRCAF